MILIEGMVSKMKLSKKFLNDYVKVDDIDTLELAEKMVFVGNEYESIEKVCEATGCVVAKVLDCIDHPDSKKLHICTVDYGEGEAQIVCGAPNVSKGIKVIVAKVGAVLPEITIKKATLAGVESNGMICALEELGIDTEKADGIYILPDDAPIGEDAIKYLGLDDEIIDFELTANRADLLNILGMAYEVGAIYDREVKEPENTLNEIKENTNDYIKVEVKTDDCSLYLGKIVKDVEIKESPEFIKSRLISSGLRPINNVVDISNYVMLEYGQPLHFFDKDSLGDTVIIRNAKDGEELTTLDKQERILTSEDVVIADKEKAICLAGVMGGLSTEVEETTKNIFIESAIFDSIKIRKTSNKILRSEASNRFEKGIDPNRTEKALNRAAYLLQKYANGKVMSGMTKYDKASHEDKLITVELNSINTVLGMDISNNEVKEALNKLKFTFKEKNGIFEITVPTRRLDVNIECDIYEEVGRIHGYENLKGKLPNLNVKRGGYSPKGKLIREVNSRLISLGLNQIRSYSLVSEKENNLFNFRDYSEVSLLSPLTEDRKILRRSLVPSILSIYNYNNSRNIKDINVFEVASVYYKKDDIYTEETMISGLIHGNLVNTSWNNSNIKADYYVLKGIVMNLLEYMGLNNRIMFTEENILKDLHPYKSEYIKVDNEIIGYMGQVHPALSKKEVYVFELSLDKLITKKVRTIKYKEVSKYPSVSKDVAFIMEKDRNQEEIMKEIKKAGGKLLTNVDVFDVYTGENVGDNEKSVAYALTFENAEKTLSDNEVIEVFNRIIENVEKKCKVKLRS
jgi:phenylalanyl-tRNA synthetase, beta subunit, non-spirochete bacterial